MGDRLPEAEEAREAVPGVWYWAVHDPRIDYTSVSHAVRGDDGVVLVDPLPLAAEALDALGAVRAVCLTAGAHQRAAWEYRRELGVPVHAPALSKAVEEEPDARYGDGDRLPGGLRAVFTPGAGTTQHALLLEEHGGVAFTADLFVRARDGALRFVPDRYMHDPDEARRSARKLLRLRVDVLCLGHGEPVVGGAQAAIERALAS